MNNYCCCVCGMGEKKQEDIHKMTVLQNRSDGCTLAFLEGSAALDAPGLAAGAEYRADSFVIDYIMKAS